VGSREWGLLFVSVACWQDASLSNLAPYSLFPTPYSPIGVTMKKRIILLVFAIFAINWLSAQTTFSGVLDSSVSVQAGAGDAPPFSMGIEEYANLRLQSKIKDKAVIYGAVNLLAAAGDYAANAEAMAKTYNGFSISPSAYIAGDNYIAGIELERLYFRLNGETVSFDGGLMRLPFGYGQVWGPSDFLNLKNPLKPDARPRGILGAVFSWYPTDEIKMLTFYSAPRDAFSREGKGSLVGLSTDKHWRRASVQALYSFQTPNDGSEYGIHRAGLSVKADVEVGLFLDTLYTYNHEAGTEIEGLSFSAGADYSFLNGNLITLAEYLYNGKSSSTALGYGGSFSNNHYLYTSLTWRFNDFTNLSAALISCFDDVSFTPVITFNHDLFQGATLTIIAQIPMDRDLFSKDGKRGELGPLPPDELQPMLRITGERLGRYFSFTARLRLRF